MRGVRLRAKCGTASKERGVSLRPDRMVRVESMGTTRGLVGGKSRVRRCYLLGMILLAGDVGDDVFSVAKGERRVRECNG